MTESIVVEGRVNTDGMSRQQFLEDLANVYAAKMVQWMPEEKRAEAMIDAYQGAMAAIMKSWSSDSDRYRPGDGNSSQDAPGCVESTLNVA